RPGTDRGGARREPDGGFGARCLRTAARSHAARRHRAGRGGRTSAGGHGTTRLDARQGAATRGSRVAGTRDRSRTRGPGIVLPWLAGDDLSGGRTPNAGEGAPHVGERYG